LSRNYLRFIVTTLFISTNREGFADTFFSHDNPFKPFVDWSFRLLGYAFHLLWLIIFFYGYRRIYAESAL